MSSIKEDSFFKPVLSTLGLIVSFIAVLTPLFPLGEIDSYFIDSKIAVPASVVAVTLGFAISWTVFAFYPYLEWRIGSKKVDNYTAPRFIIGATKIIWILLSSTVLLFYLFFTAENSLAQAIIYILFFSTIIFIFSYLVSQTKARYQYLSDKDSEAERIFSTLEKNRIVSPGIEIYRNQQLTPEEREKHDIRDFGMLKKVDIQTVVQQREYIEVVMSDDYRELLRVIKKRSV